MQERENRRVAILGGFLAGAALSLLGFIPDLRLRLILSVVIFSTLGAGLGAAVHGLLRWSFIDHTTGLFNRRHFVKQLHNELLRAHRHHHPFCLAILDIDNFKGFNDRYVHLTGDKVLKAFAGIAQSQLRRSDTLSRWGGEEFAVILPETSADGGLAVVERIRHQAQHSDIQGFLNITVSGGLAVFPNDADTPDGLVGAADTALYIAKRSGNRVLLFSDALKPDNPRDEVDQE